MSGPKTNELELERQRRQRLANALNARKEAYCRARSGRENLLKKIERNIVILESKLEQTKSVKTGNMEIDAAYRKKQGAIEFAFNELNGIMREPLPRFNENTESESTRCVEAEQLNKRTRELESQVNQLISEYSDKEKQVEENVKKIQIQNMAAKNELKEQRAKCRQVIEQTADKIRPVINSQKSVPEMENVVLNLQSAIDTLLNNAAGLLNTEVPTETEDVKKLTAKTKNETVALINTFNGMITEPLKQIGSFEASQKELADIVADFDERQKRVAAAEELTEIEYIQLEEYKEPDYYKNLEEKAREELDMLLDGIEDAACDDSVCEKDVERLGEIYLNIQKTAENSQKSLAAEIIQARDILARINLQASKFEECYCRYVTACEMLNRLYESNGQEDMKIEPAERREFLSYEEMCDEEMRIDGMLTMENERSFIRRTIGEVMREFGYSMAEEFVFRKAQKGTHFLCKKENGDTAIHVHYSEGSQKDGQRGKKRFMLEVVGVGKASGEMPEGATGKRIGYNELSEKRRQELLDEQASFCLIHPEIIKKLAERGIITNLLELNPPGLEFCEEIVTIDKNSGANLTSDVDVKKPERKKDGEDKHRKKIKYKEMEMRMGKRKV